MGTGGGWAEVLRRGHTQDGVDTERDRDMLGGGLGSGHYREGTRNELPKSWSWVELRVTYLTEREKSPWFLRLGRARKLPWTPRPLSRVSASSPLRSR